MPRKLKARKRKTATKQHRQPTSSSKKQKIQIEQEEAVLEFLPAVLSEIVCSYAQTFSGTLDRKISVESEDQSDPYEMEYEQKAVTAHVAISREFLAVERCVEEEEFSWINIFSWPSMKFLHTFSSGIQYWEPTALAIIGKELFAVDRLRIQVYSLETGRCIRNLPVPEACYQPRRSQCVHQGFLVFHNNRSQYSTNMALLWDPLEGKQVSQFDIEQTVMNDTIPPPFHSQERIEDLWLLEMYPTQIYMGSKKQGTIQKLGNQHFGILSYALGAMGRDEFYVASGGPLQHKSLHAHSLVDGSLLRTMDIHQYGHFNNMIATPEGGLLLVPTLGQCTVLK